eukprot:m.31876 g.31876  ORF g.31876 m.31876 type:complete len:69 (-) comp16545_c0_seq1:165-371(-)
MEEATGEAPVLACPRKQGIDPTSRRHLHQTGKMWSADPATEAPDSKHPSACGVSDEISAHVVCGVSDE